MSYIYVRILTKAVLKLRKRYCGVNIPVTNEKVNINTKTDDIIILTAKLKKYIHHNVAINITSKIY